MQSLIFDTCNYSEDHRYFPDARKKVVGKFKDECACKMMSEVVGLRANTSSYTIGTTSVKKPKVATKGLIEKNLIS